MINPGFDTGNILPWAYTNNGFSNEAGTSVQNNENYAQTPPYGFITVVRDDGTKSATISQTGISVLDGTTSSCNVYVLTERNSGEGFYYSFTLTIDGVGCGPTVQYQGQESFVQIRGPIVFSGDTHTISLTVLSDGVDEAGAVAIFDSFFILPIAGPGATTGY